MHIFMSKLNLYFFHYSGGFLGEIHYIWYWGNVMLGYEATNAPEPIGHDGAEATWNNKSNISSQIGWTIYMM